MRNAGISLVVLVVLLSNVQAASAHISLTSPAARNTGQKAGPCGTTGSTRGSNISVYRPGETITVTWDETVDHRGHYRIAFDLDGDDDFPLPFEPGDDFPTTLVDQIPDRDGGGSYGQEITFPNEECDNCTLQLIQIMTTQVPYNSFYFRCADITLSNSLPGSPDADVSNVGESGYGCGCSAEGNASSGWGALLLLALVPFRRRRDPSRQPHVDPERLVVG